MSTPLTPDAAPPTDWREVVARIGDLPPMPHVAARAISLVEQPATTATQLGALLASDPALTARVLKIANSAMFARQGKITTINQAVVMIGFKTLRGIIIAASLRQMNKNSGAIDKLLWEKAMFTAATASRLAQRLRRRYVDEIFVVGLLHALGQVVLTSSPETAADYERVLDLIAEENIDFVSAETRVFGFAHPLIGALVAKKWNFSADTCHAILHYRDPFTGATDPTGIDEQAAVVQLAENLGHLAGIGSPPGYPCQEQHALSLATALGLGGEARPPLDELVANARLQFENDRHLYAD